MIHTGRVLFLFALLAFPLVQAENPVENLNFDPAIAGQSPIGGNLSSGAAAPQRIDTAPLGLSNSFSEGFADITSLPGAGWAQINNSDPPGSTGWFQGNPSMFPSHQGEPNHYIAANFNNAAGVGVISNWLIAPEVTLQNGTMLSFWTRTSDTNSASDRLEVRLSTSGASTDVGSTVFTVGDFTTLMLTINPNLGSEYPVVWTQYTLIVADLPAPTSGRFAFRYFVQNAGPSGTNSDYIGIDTVIVASDGGVFADRFESPATLPMIELGGDG